MSYRLTYYNHIKKSKHEYRKSVPKSLKDRLWDTTYGPEAGQGKCYVCGAIINSKSFEAGHVISVFHGGETTLDNLKCICSTCNKSMGTQNLETFKKTYFPAIRNSLKKKCHCCCHDHVLKEPKETLKEITKKYERLDINNSLYLVKKDVKIDELTYYSDDSDVSDDSEEKERQRKLLLTLDQYRYLPNKDKETPF